ncbi:nitrate/nitrite two-component system sensor histidine kinase NarQ [Kosakonia pseudosacchari]|uniref:nitrate/nitrite two-component system sensor histidine kinase NarQ n=1 Tax=Kosakonia pseudosacchari TaxID=1646340 RepID=UPI00187F47CD|nr:nitrate/nitrite two-component system sensor histidine kinase NarQ [Kosakonia pseudosacchari]QOV62824.1 nitrate/nitrite two-component system sensor histidine kinase NarQ [Kosakonia pseudosacchari]
MIVKKPVSGSLARAFFSLVLLSLLSTGVALITLASSLRDAEAINIAGSLRMQSYRLGYELQKQTAELQPHRQIYQQTLNSPVLQTLNRWYVPQEVQQRYGQLHENWHQMEKHLIQGDQQWYAQNIQAYVGQIDLFVLALQHYAERKMMLVVAISMLGAAGIFTLVFFTLRRIRQRVVKPLNNLVATCQRIQQGQFSLLPLDNKLDNELGLLASTFDRMSGQLFKLYRSLETSVAEKTRDLHEANSRLEVMYQCSQALNTSQIDALCLRHVLQIVYDHQAACFLELVVDDNWRIQQGELNPALPVNSLPVNMQENVLGELRWQSHQQPLSAPLMCNIATILGRGLYINQAQKHYQQLMLMEERATIARELHDSLAQMLSYLRIQLALLKRSVPEDNAPAHLIIDDFSRGLNNAWQQLRELLTTFRLSLQQSSLPAALREALDVLQSQTSAKLNLDCRLPTQALDAQQQMNVLQIVREAVINAIKHAQASEITVSCVTDPDGLHSVYIRDNGIGMKSTQEPAGHYGLTIMRERAERLGGVLQIVSPPGCGTQVQFRFPLAVSAERQ